MCFFGGRCRISEGVAPSPSIAGRGTYSLAFTSCTQSARQSALLQILSPDSATAPHVLMLCAEFNSYHNTVHTPTPGIIASLMSSLGRSNPMLVSTPSARPPPLGV